MSKPQNTIEALVELRRALVQLKDGVIKAAREDWQRIRRLFGKHS